VCHMLDLATGETNKAVAEVDPTNVAGCWLGAPPLHAPTPAAPTAAAPRGITEACMNVLETPRFRQWLPSNPSQGRAAYSDSSKTPTKQLESRSSHSSLLILESLEADASAQAKQVLRVQRVAVAPSDTQRCELLCASILNGYWRFTVAQVQQVFAVICIRISYAYVLAIHA